MTLLNHLHTISALNASTCAEEIHLFYHNLFDKIKQKRVLVYLIIGEEGLNRLIKVSSEINLSADKDFNEFYMDYMMFE